MRRIHTIKDGKKVQQYNDSIHITYIFGRQIYHLTEVSRVFLSVFHLEVEIQVVTLETTGNLHSSSLLAVQTTY